MKLSQKLLALGGVTLADYACCPYDDYGMPHSACTDALPEKTPFSLEADWRNGACKAWESNVDATYDGNDNSCGTNENWGSCGFQRHFPWNQVDTENYRNRGCSIAYTPDDGSGNPARTLGSGCHCQGFGDADNGTGAIICRTSKVIVGTTTASATCRDYNQETDQNTDIADFTAADICCDPNAATNTQHVDSGNNDIVDTACPIRTCGSDDTALLASTFTTPCHDVDFLGRRNIQAKNLYLDGTANSVKYSNADTPSSLGFSHNSDATSATGAVSNAKLYNLGGVPFLGGVCKLFVPVPRTRITSVQIAGVHVSLQSQSVYAAKMDTPASSGTYSSGQEVGTAYCFSVVNPSEGMVNIDNGIHNGNVAGGTIGTNANFGALRMDDSLTSLQRQAGLEPNINFFAGSDALNIGDQLEENTPEGDSDGDTLPDGVAFGDSEVGANFDVVVHIHSEWCNSPSFWTIADMQLAGDFNNGNDDYPLNSYPAARTGSAYSDAQVGELPIKTAFNLIGTTKSAEITAETDFNTAKSAEDCYTDSTNCQTEMDAYFEAARLAAECNAALPAQDCTTQDAAETAARDALYIVAAGAYTGGCLNTNSANYPNCNPSGTIVTEIDALRSDAAAHGTATGLYNNAVYDYNQDLANSFTHAHMDLMDKRNDMVADFNDVYEADPVNSGYLRFPHSDDDLFKDVNGAKDTGLYTASASFLRWPNAGAFAAFYSFVACANPLHISGDAALAADVNIWATIYSQSGTLTAPSNAGEAYSHLGETILKPRTLVMSQSDSDYRDENCEDRKFRGNLRQVGNTVTVCGPGQLPDTDNKRCSWNWNYNSHSFSGTHDGTLGGTAWNAPSAQNPSDAEEWFDRNDPHSFDLWSSRKRRNAYVENKRKYAFNMGYWGAQEGATGDASNMFNSEVFDSENEFHAAAIQIPITDFNFNLQFKTADNESPPLTVAINTDNCFYATNIDGCTACKPSAQEFNQSGFISDVNGTPVTLPDAYTASDYNWNDSVNTIYHQTACTDSANKITNTVDGLDYNLCDADDLVLMKAATHLGSTTECENYKTSDGSGGFVQLTNSQTLTFDDSRIQSALNPSTLKWEASVRCNQVDLASMSENDAQRDFFPDCFFGEEIWFTLTYGTGAPFSPYTVSPYSGVTTNNNLSYNSYVSAWFSSVDVPTYNAQGVETTATVQEYL